jgi:hypothetical protein
MSKRFLTAMLAMLMALMVLAFGMMGCDDVVSGTKKGWTDEASDYTLTLAKTMGDQYYRADLYSNNVAMGGGAAQAASGSAIIKLSPYNGKPSFNGGTYTVRVISGSTVREKTSVTFTTGGNTPLDWSTMTVIEGDGGTGWTKYTLLLEGVTEGATYSATVYNSEGAAVGTAPGVKAVGETVAITLRPGTKAPDPYFYPGGPYSVQLKGIATESGKLPTANKIKNTETREISDFFFNEGDHGNTAEVKWEKDSVFVSRTMAGSTGSDANKVAVSLTVNENYEYSLSVMIADNDEEVVSTGSVVPKWFDESADSDGSKWSEWWTFVPYDENDVIWTESDPVDTGDLISVMRNIIDNVAAEAEALEEAEEDEPKAEKPVEEPEVAEPEAEKPVAEEPEAEKPEVVVGEPEVAEPEADEPEAEKPVVVDAEI